MKILMGMAAQYLFVSGGAQKNIRALMEGLAQRGHTGCVVAPGISPSAPAQRQAFLSNLAALGIELKDQSSVADLFHYNGVEIHALWEQVPLPEYVLRRIREFEPDWTLLAEDCTNLIEVARDADPSRMIHLIQSTVVLPYGPMSAQPNPIKAKWCRRVGGIITLSRYLQDYVRRWNGRESEVIGFPSYGAGPFPNYGNAAQGYVTLINPSLVKGLPIFLDLARALPEVSFAAVPTWGTSAADRSALEALPNVTLLAAREDVDSIYAQTRVLLVPSLWDEGFGMVAVEAMLRGIPVLASNTGGLPEAKLGVDYVLPVRPIEGYGEMRFDQVLAEPIIPPQDARPWEAALREVLSDQARYECLSTQSRGAALKFVETLNLERFEQFFESLESRPGAVTSPTAKSSATDAAWDQVERMSAQRRALLARRLRKSGGETEAKPTITRAPRHSASDTFPLTFTQQRFWFLDQLEPGNPIYNEHLTFRLRGALKAPALQRALTELVNRHEVLRTSFILIEGQPQQIISPPFEIPLPLEDVSLLAEAEREPEAFRRALEESNRPFDLTQPPMLRASLYHLNSTEHILALVIHHIASDGWSGTLLARELPALYEAETLDQPSSLPELPIQYADYAWWQRETWAKSGNVESLLAYWKQQLAGAPEMLEFPTDRPRPKVQTYQGTVRHFVMSTELAQAVRDLSQRESATAFMVLLAAFNALLHRYTGQHDILVGSPIAGRNFKEVEGLIGCFLNTLVFRTRLESLAPDPTFRELIQHVRQMALEAYAHQELPFEQLVDELHLTRDISRNPLFQVMFTFQVAPAFPYALPGFVMEFIDLPGRTTKFDFTLAITDIGDLMVGEIEYSTDLFDDATMERWVNHWQTLVAGAVADPDQRLSELPLLSQAERQQVLVEWNTTQPSSNGNGNEKLSHLIKTPEEKMSANSPEPSHVSKAPRIAGEMQDPEQIQQQIQAQKDTRPEIQSDFVAPRTPIEIKLAQIWAEVLGLERVGIHDDFFELGGHSLLATQALARASHEFRLELPMELIFASAFTIAELSKTIAQLQLEQADSQELEAMLEKLNQLSEEEARQLLAQDASEAGASAAQSQS
jgi:glycosyltransferase involved in cell wall biosynthesis